MVQVCRNVSKGVQNASVMACMKMDDGPAQTGDGYSEPNGPIVSISGTAPVSWDVAYGARFTFSERPSRAHLRGGNPAWKRSTWDSTRPHGRLKWRRVLFEFGKQGSSCERVCEASRAARRVFRSRNAGMTRSGGPARQAVQVPWACDVTGDFPVRVAGELHTLARVGNPSKASA